MLNVCLDTHEHSQRTVIVCIHHNRFAYFLPRISVVISDAPLPWAWLPDPGPRATTSTTSQKHTSPRPPCPNRPSQRTSPKQFTGTPLPAHLFSANFMLSLSHLLQLLTRSSQSSTHAQNPPPSLRLCKNSSLCG